MWVCVKVFKSKNVWCMSMYEFAWVSVYMSMSKYVLMGECTCVRVCVNEWENVWVHVWNAGFYFLEESNRDGRRQSKTHVSASQNRSKTYVVGTQLMNPTAASTMQSSICSPWHVTFIKVSTVVCVTNILVWSKPMWTSVCESFSGLLFSLLLDKHLALEWLGHRIGLCLILWETLHRFPKLLW